MIPKTMRHRDRAFLSWAKGQGGACCLCLRLRGEVVPGVELHHWGEKGMAQKGDDYRVARLCGPCHREQQGRRRMAYLRRDEMDVLEALTADALDLVIGFLQLEKKGRKSDRPTRS
jgi:hypothetical protein